jgi:chitinase
VKLTLPSWQSIAPGAFAEATLDYKLPLSGPSNYTLTFGGQTSNLAVNYGRGGVTPTGSPTSSPTGSPTGSPPPGCTAPAWNASTIYAAPGQLVSYNNHTWANKWWTQGDTPGGTADVWADKGACGGTTSPSPTGSATISPTPSPTASPTASPSPSVSPTPTPTGSYPAWAPNVFYAVGARVSYQGNNYQCRQAHTSLPGWDPVSAPALWLQI